MAFAGCLCWGRKSFFFVDLGGASVSTCEKPLGTAVRAPRGSPHEPGNEARNEAISFSFRKGIGEWRESDVRNVPREYMTKQA